MNIKQFHMKLLWAIIHPELFLLPYKKQKEEIKTREVSVSFSPAIRNSYDINSGQFTESLTGVTGHLVVLDENNNVLFNSLSLYVYASSYYSTYISVPDREEIYEYTLKAKVISGPDIDDEFHTYKLTIKPGVSSYFIQIGHNLAAHFYKFNKKYHEDTIPLTTVKIGDTGGHNVEAYQTARHELNVSLCTATESEVIYYDNNWIGTNLSPSIYAVANIGNFQKGSIMAFNKTKPTDCSYNTWQSGLQHLPVTYTIMDKTVAIQNGQLDSNEWTSNDQGREIIYGININNNTQITRFFYATSPSQSNAYLSYNQEKIPTTLMTLQNNTFPQLNIDNEFIKTHPQENKKYPAVGYILTEHGTSVRSTVMTEYNVTYNDFDPTSKETRNSTVDDYWSIDNYDITIMPHFKINEYLQYLDWNSKGLAYGTGGFYMTLYNGATSIGSLYSFRSYTYINHDDEIEEWKILPLSLVSNDYEHWLRQAGRIS